MDLNLDGPTCLENAMDLQQKDFQEVTKFFINHINQAIITPQLKTCVFKDQNGDVYKNCLNFVSNLLDSGLFVEITIHMTRRLFQFMKSSSSTSSGTLIFLHYHNLDTNKDYLGILKMDPNEGIELEPESISFKIRKHMLPNIREKLHKSAFIKLDEKLIQEESHLYVLDKQQKADGISKFFLDSFLNAKELKNDRSSTKLFTNTLFEVIKEENIPSPVSFMKKVDEALVNGKHIKIDTMLEDLLHEHITGEEDRACVIERVKTQLKKKDEDTSFEFVVDKEQETVAFIQNKDKSLQIRFKMSALNKDIFCSEEEDEDGKEFVIVKVRKEQVVSNIQFKK